ncbi:hypothetical protein AGMMS49960_10070 [Betaproteobacteria bacterium]|nr:hypothetical protein AGMMS49543_23650 [Betaproteobacteria bacterium]GHU00910.1 hypothetical protein AGMMS49960_10070 [Betaproteobacteria bacterium]GHU19848.1 hypothetical protein AGMMS50243_12870 [Betaproteobacteria bacterium]
MTMTPRLKLVTALAVAGFACPAFAAPEAADTATLQRLLERLERLEAQNTRLASEIRELKQEKAAIAHSLSSDRLSEKEPELTTRLKAVEQDVVALKPSAKLAEKLDGIEVEAGLTTVWQRASGLPHGTRDNGDKFNYRADLAVTAPLESIGDVEHKLFAHLRVGQGQGVNEPFGYLGHFSAPNASAFAVSGANPDDSVALLSEAWYQAAIPLSAAGRPSHHLEVTFGKIDIYGFFDQNEAAGDETSQFLNSALVSNPLLDLGGEVGVDANGTQPGLIASYVNEFDSAYPWRVALGVFGAGQTGSNYQDTADAPLVIAQFDTTLKPFPGLAGNYRAYAWTRRDVPRFLDDTTSEQHTGFGLSIDQKVADGVTLFGRYGQLLKGKLPFERAYVFGAQVSGNYWGRANDALGIGASWLKASSAYKRAGGEGYLSADSYDNGIADFTFTPSGAERIAEIYYRFHLNSQFSLSPDVQWIQRGGANRHADPVTVFGLRANIAY